MNQRRKELERSREIYDDIMKNGVYQPELITEGYKLLFPNKEVPDGFQARKEFISYHQHMFVDILNELEELFELEDEELNEDLIKMADSTLTGHSDDDKSKQSHSEETIVNFEEEQDKAAPKKRGRKSSK